MSEGRTHEIKNGHFHHALVEVCRAILDDLDGDNLLGSEILALDNLAKCSLA
jgi:hypothetical protein